MPNFAENYINLRREVIRKEFASLNDMQFSAVTAMEGAVLVLAGAGSGKTTVLVNRIENMIAFGNAYNSDLIPDDATESDLAEMQYYLEGKTTFLPDISVNPVRPWNILAITFTNKAAEELKNRIIAKIGESGKDVTAGTFHSLCAKILRFDGDRLGYTSRFTIYDDDDQKRVIKEVYKDLNLDDKFLPIKSTRNEISHAKDALKTPDDYLFEAGSDERRKKIAAVFAAYNERLKKADAMDFDDLIANTVKLFEENEDVLEKYRRKFRYIMVDEYQDTNIAQYRFVSLLAEKQGNICVVGDDDQSIYRFRGATIRNILEFEDEYPDSLVIRLEQNYRSTGNILDAANAVIKNNTERKGKNLWTDYGEGDKITIHTAQDEQQEAKYVVDKILDNVKQGDSFKENAVLYRVNSLSRSIENVLVRSAVPYKIIGGHKFYDRKEVKDVMAYLQLICNKNDDVRLSRIINEPKRGIGDTSLNNAKQVAQGLGVSTFEVIEKAADYPMIPKSTANKMQEFACLINRLADSMDTLPPHEFCELVIAETGYEDYLRLQGVEGEERLENVKELVNGIKEYETENEGATLIGFLEEVSLISDIDKYDESADYVVLMTVHSAKGLEFKNVYLIGVEEGIFPGSQSIFAGPEDLEEERRLAYVAITRAKRRLYITNAYSRFNYGQTGRNLPSRFISEIPAELCTVTKKTFSASPFGSSIRFSDGDDFEPSSRSYTPAASYQKPARAYTPPAKTKSALYKSGDKVEHRIFGKGEVLTAEPMGNDVLLKVQFESGETKKIMANFAKLTKL
ncbi:MAG: UvrD-helicase domain-containing protein [Clostridia bacterium]|nr:UvrD-helicase domain-containing protein [Clostridia bacterium]